jgi:hypothetical protein
MYVVLVSIRHLDKHVLPLSAVNIHADQIDFRR